MRISWYTLLFLCHFGDPEAQLAYRSLEDLHKASEYRFAAFYSEGMIVLRPVQEK